MDEMPALTVTPSTVGWVQIIEDHLRAGHHALVRFETPWMSPQQMADSIGISRPAIMRWIAQGRIRTTRYGVNHRISLQEVQRFRDWYVRDTIESNADDMLADVLGSPS